MFFKWMSAAKGLPGRRHLVAEADTVDAGAETVTLPAKALTRQEAPLERMICAQSANPRDPRHLDSTEGWRNGVSRRHFGHPIA